MARRRRPICLTHPGAPFIIEIVHPAQHFPVGRRGAMPPRSPRPRLPPASSSFDHLDRHPVAVCRVDRRRLFRCALLALGACHAGGADLPGGGRLLRAGVRNAADQRRLAEAGQSSRNPARAGQDPTSKALDRGTKNTQVINQLAGNGSAHSRRGRGDSQHRRSRASAASGDAAPRPGVAEGRARRVRSADRHRHGHDRIAAAVGHRSGQDLCSCSKTARPRTPIRRRARSISASSA